MRRLQRMQCYMQRACWLIYHRALPQVFGRNKAPLKAVCRTLDVDVNVHKQYTNQIHQIYKALILPFIQPGIVYTYQHTLLGACSPASMPTPALYSSACLSAGSPCEAEGLVQETPPPPSHTHTHRHTHPIPRPESRTHVSSQTMFLWRIQVKRSAARLLWMLAWLLIKQRRHSVPSPTRQP